MGGKKQRELNNYMKLIRTYQLLIRIVATALFFLKPFIRWKENMGLICDSRWKQGVLFFVFCFAMFCFGFGFGLILSYLLEMCGGIKNKQSLKFPLCVHNC